jgi:hypothetical protein
LPAPAEESRAERRAPTEESRGERRAAVRRAQLEPLAPGERPASLVACAGIAAVLGLANLVLYIAGTKIGGKHPGPGVLSFSVVMIGAAWGMWGRRYWAVLGFEALLALAVLTFCLLLVEASNVEALVLCLAVVGGGGWLFWKLIGVMGRLQVPVDGLPARAERPPRARGE